MIAMIAVWEKGKGSGSDGAAAGGEEAALDEEVGCEHENAGDGPCDGIDAKQCGEVVGMGIDIVDPCETQHTRAEDGYDGGCERIAEAAQRGAADFVAACYPLEKEDGVEPDDGVVHHCRVGGERDDAEGPLPCYEQVEQSAETDRQRHTEAEYAAAALMLTRTIVLAHESHGGL